MLNKIIVMGRLTRDPELKNTQSGIACASFSIACDRDFKNKDGEKECDFFNIQAWRQTAEFICKYFSKGRMIVIDGRLQARKYQDRDGNNRTATEIVADHAYFGDSKSESSGGYSDAPTSVQEDTKPGEFQDISDDDGDLPF